MEDENILKLIPQSGFDDWEDALQYISAVKSGIDLIITKNVHDFINPSIPVMYPFEFIARFDIS